MPRFLEQLRRQWSRLRSIVWFVFLVWAVTVGVLTIIQLLDRRGRNRYSSPPAGSYHGFISGRFEGYAEELFFLRFEGGTKPKWCWDRPTNFAYESFEIEWHTWEPKSHSRRAQLNPSTMRMTTEGTNLILTTARLEQMLLSTNAAKHSFREGFDDIIRLLQETGSEVDPNLRPPGS